MKEKVLNWLQFVTNDMITFFTVRVNPSKAVGKRMAEGGSEGARAIFCRAGRKTAQHLLVSSHFLQFLKFIKKL